MKPIGIDHFANFAFLNHLKVSEGGKVAFLINSSDALCLSLFCEPKPYGRWLLPFSYGNHVPFCDAASWAGRYET